MKVALITVYHPEKEVQDHVTCIAEQADLVYICDNSLTSNQQMFDGKWDNVRYVFFNKNLGLSGAFNRILKAPELEWGDQDYVFFFDQDSKIQQQHVEKMVAAYEKLINSGMDVGCLGPVFFNSSNGIVEKPIMRKYVSETTYVVSGVITSSMLCSYGNLREIGFWNESVFLDMADWDLCWRLQAAGKVCCMTDDVILNHSVGSGEKKIGPLRLRVGQPFREYYQIRDGLHLAIKKYTPLKFRIRFLAMVFVRTPLHVLFLDHKKDRFGFVCKGIADAVKGQKGALMARR